MSKKQLIKDRRTHRDYVRMADITAATQSNDEGKMIVEGLAVVFDQPTVLFEYDGIEVK